MSDQSNLLEKRSWPVALFVSGIITLFLVWFIYFKSEAIIKPSYVAILPAVNAGLNSLTSCLLIFGYFLIKKGFKKAHVVVMIAATVTSFFFLCSYLTYHHFQGDTKFIAEGLVRPVYFFILITHIVASVVNLPMILMTLWRAFKRDFERHKRIARWTLPVWLYVSVTGVLVFFFLKFFNH